LSLYVSTGVQPYQAYSQDNLRLNIVSQREFYKSEKQARKRRIRESQMSKITGYILSIQDNPKNHSSTSIYGILKILTYYMYVRKWKFIARAEVAGKAKCHIDTVSKYMEGLINAGIISRKRNFDAISTFGSEMLDALAVFFGYLNDNYLQPTFLTDSSNYLNTTNDSNMTVGSENFNKLNPKKDEFLANPSFSSKTQVTGTPGVPTYSNKPLNNTIEVSYKDQMHSVNVNLLFEEADKKVELQKMFRRRDALFAKRMAREREEEIQRGLAVKKLSGLTVQELIDRVLGR
jgi:hypothetical protein